MTTLQARSWAQVAKHAGEPRDYSRLKSAACTALGIAILVAVFAAGIAIRVFMFVPLP
ncbi:MAG TPA: hypothetical protein VMJ14_00955 [Burkholderiales bacterium]|nr:hypothetical protein [Burkholderiales bacterium]